MIDHKTKDPPEEEIEGLEDGQSSFWGDYPIDTLLIRHATRTVSDVLRRIEQGRFIMNPDFQRDFIWPKAKQSKLIESVLMRIPLPVFYLAEDEQGRMIVVDGLQRLSTFRRFVNNELQLHLPDQTELHKKRFNDLAPKLQNRIEDCQLILYIIDAKVPEQTRLDIFERVNGGVPLTRQQMRNCMFVGDATRFLKDESRTDLFLKATGGSLRTSTMRDREFVNRFCAFQMFDLDEYKNMDKFLAESLRKMNREPELLPTLSSQFRTTLANNFQLFGKYAFRRHARNQSGRGVFSAALWDVMSTSLSRYSENLVKERSETLKDAFYNLMTEAEFENALTRGTHNPRRVRTRFAMTRAMFQEALDA